MHCQHKNKLRRHHFKWLGHVLRLEGERLVKLAVKVQFNLQKQGDMFMDLPSNIDLDFDEISHLAHDRRTWKELS